MPQNEIFTPVKARASEEITLQVESAIINGQIKPGEKLLSERELQIRFGTGRGAVREALKTLKQKGLVEIKKGAKGGAFVKQADISIVGESLALFLKQKHVAPKHLVEFRESIDRTITMLAVVYGTPGDKQELVEMTSQLDLFLEQEKTDLDSLGELDRKLNIHLARMTGNPIFEWVMQTVQSGFSSHDFALYEEEYFRKATIANWQKTAKEIEANNLQRALSFIGNHYVLLRRCLEETASRREPGSSLKEKQKAAQ